MIIGIDASRAFMEKRSGIGEYARELLTALADNEYLLAGQKIILFVKPGQAVESFAKKMPANWSFCPVRFFPFFWSQLGLFFKAHFLGVDLFFSPSHALPLLLGKKTVYVLHGLEMKEVPHCYSFLGRWVNEWLLRKSLAKADKILAVSQTTAQKAVEFYKTNPGKIKVVYQGVKKNLKQFIPEEKIRPALRKLVEQPYLIYVGSLEKRKNIEKLTEAFNLIKRKNENLRLVLLGNQGYGYFSIRKKIAASVWQSDIKETGYLEEKEKIFLISQAQCLVCVSLAEGFGRTVLEALVLGVPVVVSKIKVFTELYREQANFVDQNSPLQIAAGIKKVLEDREKGTGQPIQKGLEDIGQTYNWDKIAVRVAKELISFDKK